MSDSNLTRDEARERAQLLSDVSYDVALDLTTGPETFASTVTARFRCSEPGASTWVELTAPTLRRAVLNGVELDVASVFDGDRITLPTLAADNELLVEADCGYTRDGIGLHRFVDPVDERVYLHTQLETFEAHRVYACFDQPDLKAPFTFAVTAPAEWVVTSNGAVAERPPVGPDGTCEGGLWRFETTKPISTYITAVVAGSYYEVRDEHRGKDLGLFCRRSLAEHLDADELFTLTKQGFDWFEERFDYPYAFGKYDQLFVPEFNAGAMENAACVTFLEDYVFRSKVTDAAYERRAETLLHEMAHMWFGDLVTMRWWDDLWLNESFATFASVRCQVEATKFHRGWTTFVNTEKTWAYKQDQLPSTHPIAADMTDIHTVELNYDGITYAKGASVLRQLVAWVGEDAFFAALRTYFKRHEYGNTMLEDLLAVLEDASGRDLSSWSKEWLETAGVNTLRPSFELDASGAFTSFAVLQEAPADYPTLRSHRIAIGLYDDDGSGTLVRTKRLELDVVGARTEVESLVGERRPALVLLNDDDLAYAKLRLDDASLAVVRERIADIDDSLARALCWAAAWDMTRDAELPVADYVALVLNGIGRESDIGVVQSQLAQATMAVLQYGLDAERPAGLRAIAARALELLRSAEAGSDHQLAFVRAFTNVAREDDHVAVVQGLLDGSEALDGLAVDTELRWHLLRRLSALGRADDAAVAAELERDPTAAGERHAAAARAAVPTAEAKRAAWAAIVDSDSLPNQVLNATIAGFQQHEQRELLAEFVDDYFAALPKVWRDRGNEVAHNIITGMFPLTVIDEATVAAVDAFLAGDDVESPVRRDLLEARDGMARALRVRASRTS